MSLKDRRHSVDLYSLEVHLYSSLVQDLYCLEGVQSVADVVSHGRLLKVDWTFGM